MSDGALRLSPETAACFRDCSRPPVRLYVNGTIPPASARRVAVVGSRTPSAGGRQAAYRLGRDLARAGVVVVSGLARGIDTAAHQGALDAGGCTVAFLGTGLDVLYPKSSREVAVRIPQKGALISEYPPGTPPLPFRFVHRNRLIAAYGEGVVVVEAGARSGALITAGQALAMNRTVWAVPGDPTRPTCRGSNRLLRDGAPAALEAADVLAGLGLTPIPGAPREVPPGLDPDQARVWSVLAERGAADAEELSARTRLTGAAVLGALSMLELDRRVTVEGGVYRITDEAP